MANLSNDDTAKRTAQEVYDKLKTAYETRHANNIRLYRLYRSKPSDKKDKTKANVFISITFQIINTIVPRVLKALIGDGSNFFTIKPSKTNKDKDAEKKAKALTELLRLYLKKMSFFVKMAGAFAYALIFGNVFLKVFWLKVDKEVEVYEKVKDEKTGKVTRVKVKKNKTVIDRPEIEVVNTQDFFIPTDAKDIQSAPEVIYRTNKSLESLKKNPIYAKYKKNLNAVGEDIIKNTAEELRQEIGDSFEANSKVEVLEYWTNERIIVLANGTLIRNDENPFRHKKKPFIGIINYPEPNTVNGVSEIETFESLQYWINDATNIRIDNMKQVLNNMWTVIKGSLINPIQLRSRPGGIVEVGAHDDIKPLVTPEIKASAYEEVTQMRGLIQIITGVTDYTSGGSFDKTLNDTATGIVAIQKEANERFGSKNRIWRVTTIQDVLSMITELIQQFVTGDDVKALLGEEVPDFEPEDEDIDVDYEYEISGVLSDEERLRELTATTQLVQVGSKLPTKEVEIDYDKVLDKYGSLFNLQDLIKPKEKVPEVQPGDTTTPISDDTNQTAGAYGNGLPATDPQAIGTGGVPQPTGAPASKEIPFNREQLIFIAQKTGKHPKQIIKEILDGRNPKEIVAEVVNIIAQERANRPQAPATNGGNNV